MRDHIWCDLFRTTPPVGTAIRLARRIGSKLSGWGELYVYRPRREYRREIVRTREWHKRGTRLTWRKMGIVRDPRVPLQVVGRRSAWNENVKNHHRKLLTPLRIQGFWQW